MRALRPIFYFYPGTLRRGRVATSDCDMIHVTYIHDIILVVISRHDMTSDYKLDYSSSASIRPESNAATMLEATETVNAHIASKTPSTANSTTDKSR